MKWWSYANHSLRILLLSQGITSPAAQTAGERYSRIQILRDIPAADVIPTMAPIVRRASRGLRGADARRRSFMLIALTNHASKGVAEQSVFPPCLFCGFVTPRRSK
jgi:hypothetical protein